MTEHTVQIPYLYTADVAVGGSVRRTIVASSLSADLRVLEVPKETFKANSFMSSGSHLRRRDGLRYALVPEERSKTILDFVHGRSAGRNLAGRELYNELVGGTEAVLHVLKAQGHCAMLKEDELSAFEVVSDTREVVAARTRRLASLSFFDAACDPAVQRGTWAPVKDVYAGRDQEQAGMHATDIEMATFDRWRTQYDNLRSKTDRPRLRRMMAVDRNWDPENGFSHNHYVDWGNKGGHEDVSVVPEAAVNNQDFARLLRSVAVPRSIGRRLSSETSEALDAVVSTASAYEDALSRLPPTAETAATLLRCAEVLTSRSGTLSVALREIGTFRDDTKWFEGYWKDRGPKLAAQEASLPNLGYRDEIAAPSADPEAGYLAMGM